MTNPTTLSHRLETAEAGIIAEAKELLLAKLRLIADVAELADDHPAVQAIAAALKARASQEEPKS